MPTKQELALLDVPENELDLLIGEALVAEEFGAKELSEAEKRATARRWFDLHLAEFQHAICVESSLRTKLFAPESMDRNTLFAGVADAVSTVALGVPVPVALLSARLVKYGLDKLCADTPSAAT